MTRDEQLEFCMICKNRKMDMNKGIVCNLTNEIATFENSCETFIVDEEAKEKREAKAHQHIQETQPAKEVLDTLSPDYLDRLRFSQDYLFAILGGLAAALLSATLWAAITVATEYQIGYMAIAVGLIVGFSVRYFGAGVDAPFGFIGAFMAILGCLAGNVFAQIWFFADFQHLSFFDAFKIVNGSALIDVVIETFSPMDVLFYGLALYEGYKFSFRSVSPEEILMMKKSEDYIPVPSNQKYRMPVVVVIFIGLSILFFTLGSGSAGIQKFHYEDGTLMSEGEFVDGVVHGHWKYYNEYGNLNLEGDYDNGIEQGDWYWYDGTGTVTRLGHYENGNPSGIWVSYYDNGIAIDSGSYQNGRMTGLWIQKHQNGNISAEGEKYLDNNNGVWTYYDTEGNKSSEINFVKGEVKGTAKFWFSDGRLSREFEYLENGNVLIISASDEKGNQLVTNGNGHFKVQFENGQISEEGKVENGKKIGVWKTYYTDGKLKSSGHYDNDGIYVIDEYNDELDKAQIKNGSGKVKLYDGYGNYEEGEIKGGYKTGEWTLYNSNGSDVLAEMSYIKGKVHGIYKTYFANIGVLSYEGYYEHGKRTGISTWYYNNGEVESSINYTNDKKDGTQEFFNDLGLKIREENYKNGELIL